MAKRKQLSKKTRFEVFKRDSFTCQYCGATPPGAILNADHIHPVFEGGTNDIDNLVTSCDACNLGKGAMLLSDVPQALRDKSSEVAEREAQINGYNEIMRARADRLERETWEVAAILENAVELESYNRSNLLSIKRFLEKLPAHEVRDAAEVTTAKWRHSGDRSFRYFCGVCWGRVRDHGI